MASFVLFIFIILLLPVERSAEPETCYECYIDKGDYCDGVKKTCINQTCLGVHSAANLSLEHSLISSFSRTCVDLSNNLNGSFYFDFGNKITLDFNSENCNGTQCMFGTLDPPIRKYENGKSCPKCFRTGHDDCEEDGEVFCVGDLVNCTEVKGQITHKYADLDMTTTIPFAGKGCVSQSVCSLGSNKSIRFGSFTFTFKDIKCSPATNGALSSLRRLAFALEKKDLGPQASFFFPCILGIFAVKILS
ncbi:uncharacterized protein LOC120317626 [Crotalus tigris]|uniref:uncharacterized protein LOC120317626 n=1 Tax=Crotalus tigris TaxID=88082 RepID=UPI00192F1505|nr:uncharacterized protein LOC120317626 [Crotalus tigris]